MDLKPAVLGVEHMYSSNLYVIAYIRQADLLLPILAGFLGACLSYRIDADWFKDQKAALR